MSTSIQPRLLSILQREIDSQGFNPQPGVMSQLEGLISTGIIRMRVSKSLDNPAHIMQAERNLRGVVGYFANYAREAGSFPTLDDADFQVALTTSPSFWPYCG